MRRPAFGKRSVSRIESSRWQLRVVYGLLLPERPGCAALCSILKGFIPERGVILWGVCWHVASRIGYLRVEEMTEARRVDADH
jgi:hypothetical protein